MARTKPSSTRTPQARCSSCDGRLVATQVDPPLYVHVRGDEGWSSTRLDSWTCLGCGRTDLYAAEPRRLDV